MFLALIFCMSAGGKRSRMFRGLYKSRLHHFRNPLRSSPVPELRDRSGFPLSAEHPQRGFLDLRPVGADELVRADFNGNQTFRIVSYGGKL